MKYLWDDGGQHDSEDDVNEVAVNMRKPTAEIKANECQRSYPKGDAGNVISQKSAEFNFQRAGHERHESAHSGDEARKGDSLRPIFFQKFSGSPNHFRVMRIVSESIQHFFSEFSTEEIADRIACYRAGNQYPNNNRKVGKCSL